MRLSSRRGAGVVAALLTVAMLLAACGRGDSQTPMLTMHDTVVQTTSGAVRGSVAADHRLFAGIPYAAPPVGALRWQPPASPTKWSGVRDASEFGPRCVQDTTGDPNLGRSVGEDCLTLNVWTPTSEGGPRPVMIWIHGGAFASGSGDIYDARWLTTRGDIVVVTINYRLGALGFLAHPALSGDGDVGNYGLADQQAALRWVHDNIANFGGDPTKVTIAGESAGGMSVCDHLVSPGSAGLFRAAIIQSGPCQAQADRNTAEGVSVDYAASVGCDDPQTVADCLRALPATALPSPGYYQFGTDKMTGPVTGTAGLPLDPITVFRRGDAPRVPVLIGTTHDEFTLVAALKYVHGEELPPYPQALDETFGADAGQVAERYPLDRYDGNPTLAYSAAATDGVFACPTDRMAESLSRGAPVYAYEFNDRTAPAPEPLQHLPFPVGASHSLELGYLFTIGGTPTLNPAQQRLSDEMIEYWSQFVTTGAPSAAGAPDWPAIGADPSSGPRMSLQADGPRIITDFDQAHQCPFWDSLPGQQK